MDRAQLNKLYKELENFVAELQYEEYKENEKAIKGVYTLIHQKMQE